MRLSGVMAVSATVLIAMCAIAACVGDDPPAATMPAPDAGADTSPAADGSSPDVAAADGSSPDDTGVNDAGDLYDVVEPDVVEQPCPPGSLGAFVTSQRYSGDLGGAASANAQCVTLAAQAGLDGGAKWVAWLSTDNQNARDLLDDGGVWCLANGRALVGTTQDFLQNQLKHPINVYENGAPASEQGGDPPAVWTGTLANGTNTNNCLNWNSPLATNRGGRGNYASVIQWSRWPTAGLSPNAICSNQFRLYCLRKP